MPNESRLKFHRDFGHIMTPLRESDRFMTAIRHASMIYSSDALCTWIPKNGCSSLRYSIAIANGLLDASHSVDWIHANNGLFAPALKDCYNARYSFVFLRCPVERVISVFLDKLIDSVQAERVRAQFKDFFVGQQVVDRLNFSKFIKIVAEGKVRNFHWQSQSDFLLLDRYDDYFDLKDGPRATKTLNERIGFDLKDTRSLLKHDTSHLEQADVPAAYDLPLSEILALKKRGVVPSKLSLVNADIAQAIKRFWLRDFELYQRQFGPARLWADIGIRIQ